MDWDETPTVESTDFVLSPYELSLLYASRMGVEPTVTEMVRVLRENAELRRELALCEYMLNEGEGR